MVFTVYFYIRHASLNFDLKFFVFSDWQYTQYNCRKLSVTLYCKMWCSWFLNENEFFVFSMTTVLKIKRRRPGSRKNSGSSSKTWRHTSSPSPHSSWGSWRKSPQTLFLFIDTHMYSIVQEFNVFQFGGLLLLNVSHELKRAFLVKSEWWMLYVFKIDIYGNQIWYCLIKSDGLNLFLQGNMLKT